MKKIIYLSGLPRSGSTLLSNVLGMHTNIYATPSSPLCSIVQDMRKHWSDDPFLLSQLDNDFDMVHKRLKRSMWSFMQAWSSDNDKPVVVDKNRGWLFGLEWLRELDPDFKIIITLRDLRNVYTSIEKKHRKTLFIDFPDHMEHNMVDVRANALFADGGIVGSILKALQNVKDIPNIMKHIYYWRYEDFLENPKQITNHLFSFLGVKPEEIDFDNIVQSTNESDSYYRMKFSQA
jgi:sulfotransferase